MGRKSRWIEGLSPQMPVCEAARYTLKMRLRTLWTQLEEAARNAPAQVEAIHQLRVATRRAQSALHCYEDLLPARRARWMKKRLKCVRRQASDARDYDVLIARLSAAESQPRVEGIERVIDELTVRRKAAQEPVRKLRARLAQCEFRRKARQLTRRIRWRDSAQPEPTLSEVARQKVRKIGDEFLAAAEQMPQDVPTLHALRILAKHWRYTIESFHEAFAPSFRMELHPQVILVQEKLGAFVDHAMAAERLDAWRLACDDAELTTTLEQLSANEHASADEARRQFFEWWSGERPASLRRSLEDLLSPDAQHVA